MRNVDRVSRSAGERFMTVARATIDAVQRLPTSVLMSRKQLAELFGQNPNTTKGHLSNLEIFPASGRLGKQKQVYTLDIVKKYCIFLHLEDGIFRYRAQQRLQILRRFTVDQLWDKLTTDDRDLAEYLQEQFDVVPRDQP